MSQTGDKNRSTILVVDDDEAILNVVTTILRANGYQVLSANDGASAVKLASNYTDKINLLLSDVEMPDMTGPQLGINIKESRPAMLVMLMSGFAGGDLLVLNYGWAFIQKPFLVKKLVEMVTTVLGSPNRWQGDYGYDTRK